MEAIRVLWSNNYVEFYIGQICCAVLFAGIGYVPANAQIYRWDDNTVIPGTENLVPGPEAIFAGLDLAYADLNGFDLTRADFSGSNLTSARFAGADVSNGKFTDAILDEANFANAKMDGANLSRASLRASDFSGATITDVGFGFFREPQFPFALTKEQLYSTASYQQKDLHGIFFGYEMDISGWDFSGQNLTGFGMSESNASGADFSGADLSGARLDENYFGAANFDHAIFVGVRVDFDDFTNANLNGVDFSDSRLEDINFSNVDLRNTLLPSPRNIEDPYYSKWTLFPPGYEHIDCDRGSMWCRRHVVDGDYNDDELLDVSDVSSLIQKIYGVPEHSWLPDAMFDLDTDGAIDEHDLHYWVTELRNTWIGDANLDGEFNSTDLTVVFASAKYQVDVDANWSEGDWNGDLRFTTSDFVSAFRDGGYEKGPRSVAAAVPEPHGFPLVLFAIVIKFRSRTKESTAR